MFLNALVNDDAAKSIIKSRAEPSRAEPSRAEPSRAEPSALVMSAGARPSSRTRFALRSRALCAFAVPLVACAALFGNSPAAKAQTVPSVSSIALTSDPNDDGREGDDNTYALYGVTSVPADDVEATFTFTAAVDITGTPRLTLLFGTTEKPADCAAATNATTMVCSYTVAENDMAPAGVAVKGNSLTLNGGTIRAAGTTDDADLTHAAVAAQSGHKVDGIRPTLVTTGPNAPKTSTDGTKVILTFSEDIGSVSVGSLFLNSTRGRNIGQGLMQSISGPTVELTLLSIFTIAYGDTITVNANVGVVRDSAGNRSAVLTSQTVANEVPRPPAAISMVEITSDPGSDAIYSTGDAIEVTATFDRAVAVTGKPRIRLRLRVTGGAAGDRWAEYESGSGSTELVFSYTVQSSDESRGDGIVVGYDGLVNEDIDLNGGTIKVDEPGGADASLTYSPLLRDSGHRVNWALPTLTSAATSVDGTKIFLTFSETLDSKSVNTSVFTVTVDGTAATLSGTAAVSGVTVTLTLSTALTSSTQSVVVSYDATGSSIQDLAENPVANFSNQAVTNRFGATVNVSAIALTSNPNDDGRTGDDSTYAVGDTVAATVTFDDAVDITGTPRLTLLFGTAEKNADCAAATNTTTMVCSYEVAANDAAPAGVAISANTLALNGGTIRAAGSTTSDASLTHTGAAAQAAHKVDGVKPTLVATGSNAPRTSADGTKAVLTFSEDIGSVDRTRITLIKTLMSATSTLATIAASTSGDTVEITLTSALTSSDTSVTVELAAGAVEDLAGNGNAAVAETAVTTADNTAPTLTGASTHLNDTVQLLYDEALDLTSQPAESAFTVEVGGVARPVTMVSFSGNRHVNLVLGSAFRPGDTLTVSYEKPATGPIQDAARNDAASFADQAVTNSLAATAPDALGHLDAQNVLTATNPVQEYGDALLLGWTTPWHNGRDITKYQYRYAPGTSIASSVTWVDIPDSAPGLANANAYRVTELISGTEYTFEVRAVNGIGNGAEAPATATTPMPTWELTLTDSNGNAVPGLLEGGASATVTVRIYGVRFSTDQTVQLERRGRRLENGRIQGAGGTGTITIPAGESSGSLDISAPEPGGTASYVPPSTFALSAIHAGRQVGESIDLTFVDDEPPPAASIARAPTEVSEGDDIEIRISLNLPTLVPIGIRLAVTDTAGALSGTPPAVWVFAAFETASTVTLTAADNEVQNDGAREVTLTLALSPPDAFTLGDPSSVTVTVLDNDTPPSAPRNLAAETRDGEARLTWQAPLTDNGIGVRIVR